MHLRMIDNYGRLKTVVVKDVYYEPSLTYNLISVSDMSRSKYTSIFSEKANIITGPAGTFDLISTSDVYALPTVPPPAHALGAVGKMTPEEIMHLRLNHIVNPRKMAILSKSGARGIPEGLKEHTCKCQVCQHANITRSPAAPAATGSDSFDMSFDLINRAPYRQSSACDTVQCS